MWDCEKEIRSICLRLLQDLDGTGRSAVLPYILAVECKGSILCGSTVEHGRTETLDLLNGNGRMLQHLG